MGEGSSGTWSRRRAAAVALLPAAALIGGCATWTYPTTDTTASVTGDREGTPPGTQATPLPPDLQEALRNAVPAGRRGIVQSDAPTAPLPEHLQKVLRDATRDALPTAASATPMPVPAFTSVQPVAAAAAQTPTEASAAPSGATTSDAPAPAAPAPAAEAPAAATPEPAAEPAGPAAGQRATAVEDQIVALANSARQAAGIAPLQRSGGIDAVAVAWAVYLASNGLDLQHNGSFSSQIPGGWTGAAENIGRIDDDGRFNADEVASRIHQSWMNSSGHSANLLNPAYTHIGVGVAVHPDRGYYLVQDFATY